MTARRSIIAKTDGSDGGSDLDRDSGFEDSDVDDVMDEDEEEIESDDLLFGDDDEVTGEEVTTDGVAVLPIDEEPAITDDVLPLTFLSSLPLPQRKHSNMPPRARRLCPPPSQFID